MRTLVIIPAFNEEQVLPSVLEDLREHAPGHEVLVVNDGSTDRTSQVARENGAHVVDLPFNLGIGGAMQTGFKYALGRDFDAAVQFDGDGQHRADELESILGPLRRGASGLVIGSRFLEGSGYAVSVARRLGIWMFSVVLSAITRTRLTDATSGFRAYGRAAVRLFASDYPDDYPEVEAVVMLHNSGIRIEEVPVHMRERRWGASSITPLRSVYYTVKVLLSILLSLGRRGTDSSRL